MLSYNDKTRLNASSTSEHIPSTVYGPIRFINKCPNAEMRT